MRLICTPSDLQKVIWLQTPVTLLTSPSYCPTKPLKISNLLEPNRIFFKIKIHIALAIDFCTVDCRLTFVFQLRVYKFPYLQFRCVICCQYYYDSWALSFFLSEAMNLQLCVTHVLSPLLNTCSIKTVFSQQENEVILTANYFHHHL